MLQFDGLGVNWTGTLLGCVATALVPIPVFFYLYGHRIRAKSRFAPDIPTMTTPSDEGD